MQDELTLSSGNTYIQFSFEKSLRKYQKQPYKKIKPSAQCTSTNKHHAGSLCKHCVGKIHRQSSAQFSERVVNFQNARKNEFIRSRCKARQFSETKKKKDRQSSAKRESTGKNDSEVKKISDRKIESRSNYYQPLSQFKLDEQINVMPSKEHNKLEFIYDQNNDHQEMPIKSFFEQENKENKESDFQQKDNNNERIIVQQSQDESFCNIEIGKICQDNDRVEKIEGLFMEHQKIEEKQLNTDKKICFEQLHHQVSYAYFSSCSSIDSFIDQEPQNNDFEENQPSLKLQISPKINNPISQNPFELLKLQSKEELKKECRKENRERIFYKIKKINQVEKVWSECESISESIQKELGTMENENQSYEKCEQNNNIKSLQTISPHQANQHPIQLLNQTNQNSSECEIEQSIEQPTNPSFKRDRKTFETPYQNSTRRKSTKINFQIEQNYQCLGRIRISGLGEEKESICLSIRRFSTERQNNSFLNKSNDIKIDKTKMVDYLISQRPYLQKSRQQLITLLQQIIDSQQQNSIAKRLFK